MNTETFDKQKEILETKLHSKLEAAKVKVGVVGKRIATELGFLNDYLIDCGKNKVSTFSANGVIEVSINERPHTIHEHAIGQLAERFGVPVGYAKKMSTSDSLTRDLLATIFNEHMVNTDRQRLLFRSVGTEVRGVLSDSYKRLNSSVIYSHFMKMANSCGARVIDAFIDDTRTSMELIVPNIFGVPTENNGVVPVVFGARMSNSDFGDGALNMQGYLLNVVCLNGMTRQSVLRQVHIGKRIPDGFEASKKTYELDTDAQVSLIDDFIGMMFSRDYMENYAQSIQAASRHNIMAEAQVKLLPKLGLTKAEINLVQSTLTKNRKEDGMCGESTVWKMTQAITVVAREQKSERRKREIEDIASKFLDSFN